MASDKLPYEIREVPDADDGIVLELHAQGVRLARATASRDIIADIDAMLGVKKAAVEAELRTALVEYLKNQLATVEVAEPVEDSEKSLLFRARFTQTVGDEIRSGVVWYDVTESKTGPESLPAVVRNKMRHAVHRQLTTPGSSARALVDMHT